MKKRSESRSSYIPSPGGGRPERPSGKRGGYGSDNSRSAGRSGGYERRDTGDRPFRRSSEAAPSGRPFQKSFRRDDNAGGGFRRRDDAPGGEQRPYPRREDTSGSGPRPYPRRDDRTDRPFRDKPPGAGRPYGERRYGDKPDGDRPFVRRDNREGGDRPYGERKFNDKPYGERRYGDKPAGDRPYGEKRYDKPYGDKPYGQKHRDTDRPEGERRTEGAPNGDKPMDKRERNWKWSDQKPSYKSDRRDQPSANNSEGGFRRAGNAPDRGARDDRNNRDEGGRDDRNSRSYGRPLPSREISYEDIKKQGDRRGSAPEGRRDDRPFERRDERPSDRRSGPRDERRNDKPFERRDNRRGGHHNDRRSDLPAGQSLTPPEYQLHNPKTFGKKPRGRANDDETEISSDEDIRLNRYIANAGICSRREADLLIASGEIKVNGVTVNEMGTKVKPGDVVKYGNRTLSREKMVYVLLNKPKDYITTTDDPDERKTVMELVGKACQERIYPVGRLDRNTTGLLLLTNDGELAEKLAHPSNEIQKLYEVELDRPIQPEHYQAIIDGVELEDGLAKVDDLAIVSPDRTCIGIALHLGRNRIVRRIFEHLGYKVERLDRTIYAGLTKKDLPRGNWRYLTEKEVIRMKYFL